MAKWCTNEIKFILDNPQMTTPQMAKHLGRKTGTVEAKRHTLTGCCGVDLEKKYPICTTCDRTGVKEHLMNKHLPTEIVPCKFIISGGVTPPCGAEFTERSIKGKYGDVELIKHITKCPFYINRKNGIYPKGE